MIRAHIGEQFRTEPRNRSIILDRHVNVVDLITSMNGRREAFAPLLNPFHGLSQLRCQVGDHRFFGIHIQLAAESASHFRGNDANELLGKVKEQGKNSFEVMGNLGGGPNRKRPLSRQIFG